MFQTAAAAAALTVLLAVGPAAAQDAERGKAVRSGSPAGSQTVPAARPLGTPSPSAQGSAASPEAKAAAARAADDKQAEEAKKRAEAQLARREQEMKKVMRGICTGC